MPLKKLVKKYFKVKVQQQGALLAQQQLLKKIKKKPVFNTCYFYVKVITFQAGTARIF